MTVADIINLRAAKKVRKRADARAQGDANATKFGRSKAERSLQDARAAKASQALDGHKINREDDLKA